MTAEAVSAPPASPALDMAISHATLDRVAAGELPACARLYRPCRTLALSKADLRRPGADAAADAGRRRDFVPVVRLAGGQVVAYHEDALIYEQFTPRHGGRESVRGRYDDVAGLIVDALREAGVDAEIRELPGEFCPGRHSITAGGRVKLAGLAQRVVARAALVSAVILVRGAEPVRETLVDAHAAMRLPWEPATVGAVEDIVPGIHVGDLEELLRRRSADRGMPCRGVDDDTRRAAGRREGRHRHPPAPVSVRSIVSDTLP